MHMTVCVKVAGLTALGTRTRDSSATQGTENSGGFHAGLSVSQPQPCPAGATGSEWKSNSISPRFNPCLSAETSPRVPTVRMALGFQHLSTRNWTYTPNSFHAATRQTSDGGNFWSLLSGWVTWCPAFSARASPVSRYLSQCGIVKADGDSKRSLFREALPASTRR